MKVYMNVGICLIIFIYQHIKVLTFKCKASYS